jgi:hypothetical protein
MPKLNDNALRVYNQDKASHHHKLRELMNKPFDANNPNHMKAVKRLVDEFEYQSHQMYVYQALGEMVNLWGASWALSYVLPIPEFLTYTLSYGLYIGGASLLLKNFNYSNFMEQTTEMQQLYDWCMKGNMHEYDGKVDNTDKLKHSEIQRLIRVLAPMSSPDFMIAWKRVTDEDAQAPSMLSSVWNYGSSFFTESTPYDPSMAAKIKELQANVELGQMTKGSFEGLKQAVEYFATSSEFRALMQEKAWDAVKEPLAIAQDRATDVVILAQQKVPTLTQ